MKKILLIIAAVIVAAAIFLPKLLKNTSDEKVSAAPGKAVKSQTVNAIIISPKPIRDVIISNGSIMGSEEVDLKPEISGKITNIYFQEGARVKKGALLVKINDSEFKAQLLKSQLRKKLAEDKEYRLRQLLQKEGASREQYDIAQNELNTSIADIEYYQALIDKTEIRAPFDGIAGLRFASEGSYITPEKTIATIQAVNPIKIDFSIPQKYYGIVKVGSTALFKIPQTDRAYTARIYAIEPKIDPETRTIHIRGLCSNESGTLMPGAYIRVELILQEIADAMSIPTEALMPDIQGEKVFLYKSGIAVEKLVQTGIRSEKDIQIIEGLSRGDTVITSGIIQLKNKMPVKLANIQQ